MEKSKPLAFGTVKLKFPIKDAKVPLKFIELRPFTPGDQLQASRQSNSQEEMEMYLISAISGLSFAEIAALDIYDYMQCQEVLSGYYEGKR